MKKLGYDGHIGLETMNFGKRPEEFWQQAKIFDTKKIKPIAQIKRIAPDKDTWEALNITDDGVKSWRTSRAGAKLDTSKELEDAAFALIDETIPLEKRIQNYKNVLEANYPDRVWTPEQLQKSIDNLPTDKEIAMSVGNKSKTKKIVGVNDNLKTGDSVELRLDIPAYQNTDTWTLTFHAPKEKGIGEVMAYGKTGHLKNVTFKNENIGRTFQVQTGDVTKFPMSTMKGKWIDHNSKELANTAKQLLDDPDWVQIGFNPKKSLQFYERSTMNPVLDAEEIIQVGGFVIAKNPTTGKHMESIYEVGDKGLRLGKRATEAGQKIPAGTQIPYSGGGLVQDIDIFTE